MTGYIRGYDVPPASTVRPWVDKKAAEKAAERKADDEIATAEKQKGIARGAIGKQAIVDAAKAVARRLGANGPVTIDDVVHEMVRMGYTNVGAGTDERRSNWKGSVFSDSEWACVGQIASRVKTAKGRNVRMWALKSWLRLHPVNGTGSEASAFSLYSMYQEAAHYYPAGTRLALLLGRDMLDSSFLSLVSGPSPKIKPDGTTEDRSLTLYGCRVYPFAGVGAIFLPERAIGESLSGTANLLSIRSL